MKFLPVHFAFFLACFTASATDITTLKGRKYANVHDVLIRGDILSFSTDTEIIKIPLTDLPPETVSFYQKQLANSAPPAAAPTPAPASALGVKSPAVIRFQASIIRGLETCRQNQAMTLTTKSAFTLSELEKAKTKAQQEGKLIGFIMKWDEFLDKPARPMEGGSSSGMAHFYGVFNEAIVLVFVRHEDEIGSAPDAVKRGFLGPDEGGFAPNMAVTDAAVTDLVVEIPFGGEKSDGRIREGVFATGAQKMSRYLEGIR